ncbi:cytochrome P450 2J2-like [Patiria miniata]|uniref:Cytochrome P450 n=1 Tax=Patiria miniata TaxID=46514 RepID=A0A914BA46_PATMI|nr:cytochrome P450 2J2-like [Patiria miniata]
MGTVSSSAAAAEVPDGNSKIQQYGPSKQSGFSLPPGPRGWPLLGNLPQLMGSRKQAQETISELSRRYGKIVRIDLAGTRVVVLHGHRAVKAAFAQRQLSARPKFHITDTIIPGTGILGSSGNEWTEIRAFIITVLKGQGIGRSGFEQNIAAEAAILAEAMSQHNGRAFDPRHLISNAVSNIICSVVFGRRFQYSDPAFERLLRLLTDMIAEAGAGGLFEFSPVFVKLWFLPPLLSYIRAIKSYYSHVRVLFQEHGRQDLKGSPRDLIDVFFHEKQEKERVGVKSPALQTENLLRILTDLFGAGTETTATTLRWAMLYMMGHPEIQSRVQRELDGVTGRNRLPRIADKPELPYTKAVLCEIQRVATVVPLGLSHRCSEDTTLMGYKIPKGTIINANIWHNHFDPLVWEEPEKFRPERFLDRAGKFRPREELIPFGTGRRSCPGEHLAKMELFIFFTHLLHHFTFKRANDASPISFEGRNGVVWSPLNFQICAVARE